MGIHTRLYAVSEKVFSRYAEADQLDELLCIVTEQSDDTAGWLEQIGESLDLDKSWPDLDAVLGLLDERYAYAIDAQALRYEREPGDAAQGDFGFWTLEGVSMVLHEFALMFFEVVQTQGDPVPDNQPETIAAFLRDRYGVMLSGDLNLGLQVSHDSLPYVWDVLETALRQRMAGSIAGGVYWATDWKSLEVAFEVYWGSLQRLIEWFTQQLETPTFNAIRSVIVRHSM